MTRSQARDALLRSATSILGIDCDASNIHLRGERMLNVDSALVLVTP